MKIISLTSSRTIAVFAAILLFAACKRDKTTNNLDISEDTYYAEDQARMDQTFNDVENLADQAATTGSSELKGEPSILGVCATVTRDTVSVPHTVTINFGTTNCTCRDGRVRRGKIIVTYNGRYRDSGYSHVISFDNYFVNDNQVMGTKSVTNMGHNSSGQSYYNINVDGKIVLNSTGDTIKHVATRVRTWTAGESTLMISDDEYRISGTGTNTRRNGKVVTYNITSPLLIAMNCNWVKEGPIEFTPAGATTAKRTLDFGAGTCDDQATMTTGTRTKTITLR